LFIYRATPNEAGLVLVADLGESALTKFEGGVADTPSGLYFSVRRAGADELWRSTNAIDPPSLVRRFEDEVTGAHYLRQLARDRDGVTFWVGNEENRGATLWESRGTPGSTRPIGVLPDDVVGGAVSASGALFLAWGSDAAHGSELWAIDRGSSCAGDCDADGAIGIADLIAAVDIALGSSRFEACASADTNSDLQLSIDELVALVARALRGCG
jgi:hypothetical protein